MVACLLLQEISKSFRSALLSRPILKEFFKAFGVNTYTVFFVFLSKSKLSKIMQFLECSSGQSNRMYLRPLVVLNFNGNYILHISHSKLLHQKVLKHRDCYISILVLTHLFKHKKWMNYTPPRQLHDSTRGFSSSCSLTQQNRQNACKFSSPISQEFFKTGNSSCSWFMFL